MFQLSTPALHLVPGNQLSLAGFHVRSFATKVPVSAVKELRERTGSPMMDCKNALEASGGDVDGAIDWLRKKGMASAAKKEGRKSADGAVAVLLNGTLFRALSESSASCSSLWSRIELNVI